jgi:O-antigen/teichoic acid export membrane protein
MRYPYGRPDVTGTVRRDESTAATGARWIAVAMVSVGLSNYGYALLLTHLLDVATYSRFAAGQGLILWATTIATVSVPWVLAQALVRARSEDERNSAIRFAKLASAGSGIIVAGALGAIATEFANPATVIVLALSIVALFMGTTTTGWLQGRERMRSLAALYMAENVLKNGAGILLVMVARLGDAGALGAFGIGALVMLVRWPRTPRGAGRTWFTALANRDLWRRAAVLAGAQAVVSLFVAVDVVLVALLPGDRALAASYQASATLSRVPLYIASAVATAFFPSLSRRTGGVIAARAVRMYAVVAIPLAVVLATIPAPVLAVVFPAQYAAVATLLKYTAVTGLAAGGISLITAFFQAADDYSCLWWLGAGLAGYVGALVAGWRIDGIVGLAVGGALGAAASLVLIGYRLVRRQGRGVLAWVPVVQPMAMGAVLMVLRPYPLLWLAAASLVGLHAGVHFVRPGARHARDPRWASSRSRRLEEQPALSLLIETVWRRATPKATDLELRNALTLARLNRVEGPLARAYPAQLADVLAEIRSAEELYTRNLNQAFGRLHYAGIPAVVIRGSFRGGHACTTVDLLISEQHWHSALTALTGWYLHSSTYRLERSTTALLYPAVGPGLQLHTGFSWFGVPELSTGRLLARARRNRQGILVPASADCLRILVGNALFQNLELNLSELLDVCNLLRPAVIMAARTEAVREGWRPDFDDALAAAASAIDRLDQRLPIRLPVPVPIPQSLGIRARIRAAGTGWKFQMLLTGGGDAEMARR